jgi:starch synthase (maltosyl-transferring)
MTGQIVSPADSLLANAPTSQAKTGSHTAPRIYYVHPLLAGPLDTWDEILDHAADLGFDTILIAPPFEPGHGGSIFLPRDMTRLHAALGHGNAVEGLTRLAEKAGTRGLALALDVVLDRVAADSVFACELGLTSSYSDVLDPRQDPADREAVVVPFNGNAVDHPYMAMLADRLRGFTGAGVSGFRCLHWDTIPQAALKHLIGLVRGNASETRFLAWTPGTKSEARQALRGTGFDGTFSSLRWWDLRQSWITDEHEQLRSIGYEIAFPEVPFDKRIAHEVEPLDVLERRATRALFLAASIGDGLLVPMGFEYGCRDRFDPTRGNAIGLRALQEAGSFDLMDEVRQANRLLAESDRAFGRMPMHLLVGHASPVTALLRIDAEDARQATAARLIVANADLRRPAQAKGSFLVSESGGHFIPFREVDDGSFELTPATTLVLRPGEVRILEGRPLQPIVGAVPVPAVEQAVAAPRLAIESISPTVDGGEFPVKRIVGETVRVEADIIGDGHDPLAVALVWRAVDEGQWRETRMTLMVNDRWSAEFPLERLGRYEFAVQAWRDPFGIFRSELGKKHAAGLDVTLELEEGRLLVEDVRADAQGGIAERVQALAERLLDADYDARLEILLAPETSDIMTAADRRPFLVRSKPIPVDAERTAAGFASWYELFPRSMSDDPNRHGTFDDVIRKLPYIRDMGFDVLYMTPIHPIGRTHRKGRNNSLTAGPDDPGSPYAIGSEAGGHDAIHPELGTFDDFRRLVAAAADHGLELALDIAVQASPDHPWLKEHPDWFDWRPDGTIKYAENPPKKYEDIVNVDFYAEGAMPSLWVELRDTILLWVKQGVRLFRIDNPHTKPFPFWEWLIADVRRDHPDVAFLAEAFTRPKIMYRLAKIGFSQSYTYFTWRNEKWELTEYMAELTQTAPKDFFRPHFFVNTPDINPDFLQNAPRSAYLIRAALATTLSGLWGMYNGFELCEGRPDAKKKEYDDSEKYEIRAWDWDRPGNIVREITILNRIRRDNPALHSQLGISFLNAWNDNILFFEKATRGRENVLLVAISLDPHHAQEADIELPLWKFGLSDHDSLTVEDLVRQHRFTWTGKYQRIRLDSSEIPFSIWRISAKDL